MGAVLETQPEGSLDSNQQLDAVNVTRSPEAVWRQSTAPVTQHFVPVAVRSPGSSVSLRLSPWADTLEVPLWYNNPFHPVTAYAEANIQKSADGCHKLRGSGTASIFCARSPESCLVPDTFRS